MDVDSGDEDSTEPLLVAQAWFEAALIKIETLNKGLMSNTEALLNLRADARDIEAMIVRAARQRELHRGCLHYMIHRRSEGRLAPLPPPPRCVLIAVVVSAPACAWMSARPCLRVIVHRAYGWMVKNTSLARGASRRDLNDHSELGAVHGGRSRQTIRVAGSGSVTMVSQSSCLSSALTAKAVDPAASRNIFVLLLLPHHPWTDSDSTGDHAGFTS
ncbi:hypothetical protein C8R45DRAFT_946938 [Mycena sanguinolenta]|nr:hypothetical protein C8R45DRAFT_946938 [Mycena sanguinolenta]